MSHASSLEKANLSLKKIREARKKKRAAEAEVKSELGQEKYEEMLRERGEKTLKQRLITSIWDYKMNQFPISRSSHFKKLLNERLREIGEPTNRLELDEKREIEVILDDIDRKSREM